MFINGEIKISIIICRCQFIQNKNYRWKIRLDTGLHPDITIAIRMDTKNQNPLDYYLLPAIDIDPHKTRFGQDNGIALDSYRFEDLELLFAMAERIPLQEAI